MWLKKGQPLQNHLPVEIESNHHCIPPHYHPLVYPCLSVAHPVGGIEPSSKCLPSLNFFTLFLYRVCTRFLFLKNYKHNSPWKKILHAPLLLISIIRSMNRQFGRYSVINIAYSCSLKRKCIVQIFKFPDLCSPNFYGINFLIKKSLTYQIFTLF